jgi:hypothetical protein
MSLWMPLLDHVRSYTLVVQQVRFTIGDALCVESLLLSRDQIAALRYHGNYRVVQAGGASHCDWMLVNPQHALDTLPGPQNRIDVRQWRQHATIRRPSDKADDMLLYARIRP